MTDLTSTYLPYGVRSTAPDGTLVSFPATTRKRSVSLAREAHKNGHKDIQLILNQDNVTIPDEEGQKKFQDILDNPPTRKKAETKGSSEVYTALSVLSAVASNLAGISKKAELNAEQRQHLLQSMESVDTLLSLTE